MKLAKRHQKEKVGISLLFQDVDLTQTSFDSNIITGFKYQELNPQNLWNIC